MPTSENLSKIEAIQQFMRDHWSEAHSVLNAVIAHLKRNDTVAAQYKVMLDTDKFSEPKVVLKFMDSLGLVGPEFRERLVARKYL